MKKQFLLPLMVFAALAFCISACKKDKETTPDKDKTGCPDGSICFTLDGTAISKGAGGYYFADTFVFVKYEEGVKQLSIDIFGNTAKSYTVGDLQKVNNARIYYFPDHNNMYMSPKGSLAVTELTTDLKLTGTFSGTLYKYDNNNKTFNYTDSVVITNGSFTKAQLTKTP